MARVNVGHFVLGTAGLALLRTWLRGDSEALARRVREIMQLVSSPANVPMSFQIGLQDLEIGEGYARWATTYDSGVNPLIRVEEPVVRRMIDACPVGAALDAACGTGRHTEYLAERGHRVVGVDASPEMLDRARSRLPEADLRIGRLEALPLETGSMDLAVCALALTHTPEVAPAVRDLARVLRPGGRLVISDLHPTMMVLGGTGFFLQADGTAGNVRSHYHPHAEYLAAFAAAKLQVVSCEEVCLVDSDIAAFSAGMLPFAEEAFHAAWVGVPNALVWELSASA
jgi:ubiquinone/menaquinone biosynthesis C-methylase UbiE